MRTIEADKASVDQIDKLFDEYFEGLWKQFEADRSIQSTIVGATPDDTLWFCQCPTDHLLLLIQNPHRFVKIVGGRRYKALRLGASFAILAKPSVHVRPGTIVIQGIDATGSLNVQVPQSAADGTGGLEHDINVAIKLLLGVLFPGEGLRPLSNLTADAFEPFDHPERFKHQITISKAHSTLFSHMKLAKANAGIVSIIVAKVLARAAGNPKAFVYWLNQCRQTSTLIATPTAKPVMSTEQVAFEASGPPEILMMGVRRRTRSLSDACLCTVLEWIDGKPVPVTQVCAKPYAT